MGPPTVRIVGLVWDPSYAYGPCLVAIVKRGKAKLELIDVSKKASFFFANIELFSRLKDNLSRGENTYG